MCSITKNLSCLYVYNSRERDGDEPITVTSIAFHRSTSVIIGVLWAAIVSRYWWPFTARRELRMGISESVTCLSIFETSEVDKKLLSRSVVPLLQAGHDL